MTDTPQIFDRKILRQKNKRAAKNFDNHRFLYDFGFSQLEDRLKIIKKDFKSIIQIGAFGHHINNALTLDSCSSLCPDIIADEECLPFKENSQDLIISNLNLHATNDLPGVLSQIKYALKPDGLFIASILGGETLYELRDVMQSVEIEHNSGITPRIFPFADMQQMGALMQRAGFNLPVIDNEKVTVTYEEPFKLFHDLRYMGQSNIISTRRKNFTSRQFFMDVVQKYQDKYSEDDGRIVATFEVIFILGWKPHDSQQKPLPRGSAKNRLADALNTKEGNLPW